MLPILLIFLAVACVVAWAELGERHA